VRPESACTATATGSHLVSILVTKPIRLQGSFSLFFVDC
jgi:hypothetical protein